MADKKQFECLRCDHRFMLEHDPKQVVERTCPKCRSNSVRLAPPARTERSPKKAAGA